MDVVATSSDKSRRTLTALPLLVVLFVVSYCLLTKLVILQDKTIDSQLSLIHLLFNDNVSLSRLHKHAAALPKALAGHGNIAIEFQDSSRTDTKANTPSDQVQSNQVHAAQTPSSQIQTGQVQASQVPSNRSGPQANAKTGRKVRKAQKPAPPPVELTDPSDMRRVSFSI